MDTSLQTFDHSTFLSPFTWRYGSEAMRALWSEQHKRLLWRRLWVALAEAQQEAGLVSQEEVDDLKTHQNELDIGRSHAIESEIHHDLMAEIRAYAEQCPRGGGIIHLGATSMDIEDNTDALRLRDSLALIQNELVQLLRELSAQISEFADMPAMAYTHLQPAEPTTTGYRLAQYAQDIWMDLEDVISTRQAIRGKGLKGAVGSSASYARLLQDTSWCPSDLEAAFMHRLDLMPFSVTTQVYPRKQDLKVLNVLAGLAASLHKMAFDLRVLQSPPFGEMAEPFGSKQVGSSAMPFKRNPINSEKVCSLTRYVGALPSVAWQNAANCLLERTLDDSANRRVILANAFIALDEAVRTQLKIVRGWKLQPEGIERNLSSYGVFAASEALLMELVKAGGDRQAMHEVIREHSLTAWATVQRGEPNPLASLLSSDASITHWLSKSEISQTLNVASYVGDAAERSLNFATELRVRLDEIEEDIGSGHP
jgi:adenylosuccinate lyase